MHRHPLGEAVITSRSLLVAALVAATLSIPGYASARPTPPDGPASPSASVSTSDSGRVPASGGRTDQQFWGEATWLNPLSGLNLDRSS